MPSTGSTRKQRQDNGDMDAHRVASGLEEFALDEGRNAEAA